MTLPDRQILNQPFAAEELRSFEGRGGKTYTYIEDETVMDRLDAAFGLGGWQLLTEPVPVYEGVVKVKLGVKIDDEWVWFEDYGYPNGQAGETLKEAVSDGIRRCGRFVGIARDLYRKDRPQIVRNAPAAPTPIRPAAAAPRSSTAVPESLSDLDWEALSPIKPEARVAAVATQAPPGTMTYGELADRANIAGVPIRALTDASKKMFGQKFWKLTDLTPEQRWAIAEETGLA